MRHVYVMKIFIYFYFTSNKSSKLYRKTFVSRDFFSKDNILYIKTRYIRKLTFWPHLKKSISQFLSLLSQFLFQSSQLEVIQLKTQINSYLIFQFVDFLHDSFDLRVLFRKKIQIVIDQGQIELCSCKSKRKGIVKLLQYLAEKANNKMDNEN